MGSKQERYLFVSADWIAWGESDEVHKIKSYLPILSTMTVSIKDTVGLLLHVCCGDDTLHLQFKQTQAREM
jgi:hypothetical protein